MDWLQIFSGLMDKGLFTTLVTLGAIVWVLSKLVTYYRAARSWVVDISSTVSSQKIDEAINRSLHNGVGSLVRSVVSEEIGKHEERFDNKFADRIAKLEKKRPRARK